MRNLLAAMGLVLATVACGAKPGDTGPATSALNALGCDLLARSTGNALVSPYSIQTALGMTYAGAAGNTRDEMARVLHLGEDEPGLHRSFAALQRALEEAGRAAEERRKQREGKGGDPVILAVANRLFGQRGYAFRPTFLSLVEDTYGAPLQQVDFAGDAPGETRRINAWVERQTRDRIRQFLPDHALNALTRLVLVNAVYLKIPWEVAFSTRLTRPAPFRLGSGESVEVPTLNRTGSMGYRKGAGYTAVTVPYLGEYLHFLVLVPDDPAGLAAVEQQLTPALLADLADLPRQEVELYLPRFRMEPPLLQMSDTLKELGMRRAFDDPAGSADFDRMAPRRADDYLCISEIFHKAFLEVDEKGTEAAAATAVVMQAPTAIRVQKPEPVVVRVDRPFVLAVQHRASGACLFIGRLTDPR